jgi:hypothetical protein
MKMNRNFNEFTDFESLELEVPTFCLLRGAFRHAGTDVNASRASSYKNIAKVSKIHGVKESRSGSTTTKARPTNPNESLSEYIM